MDERRLYVSFWVVFVNGCCDGLGDGIVFGVCLSCYMVMKREYVKELLVIGREDIRFMIPIDR